MALSPPAISRTRASSTSLGNPVSLQTLGRRRSNSCLLDAVSQTPPPPTASPPSPTMLDWFLARLVHVLQFPQKHTDGWSEAASTDDEFALPLSASSDKLSFTIESEPQPKRLHIPSVSLGMLVVISMLPVSTGIVLWCLSTLPISLSWPHNISDLAQLGRELHGYSQSGLWPLVHVIGVMAISAIWKHAWSIPGSVLWNVLAGALFSPLYATVLLTALTTVGSACATLLAAPLGPFLEGLFPRAFDMTRTALGGDSQSDKDQPKSSAWVRLSVLRLIGVVPWSGINIACGVCRVSLVDCMLGTFIGCLPWTAVTCQIGDILQTVASTPSPTTQTVSSLLTTPDIIFKLVFLSVISLAPILGRTRLRAMIATSPQQEERQARWMWVQDWRAKIRRVSTSRSRQREQDEQQLDMLLEQKRRMDSMTS